MLVQLAEETWVDPGSVAAILILGNQVQVRMTKGFGEPLSWKFPSPDECKRAAVRMVTIVNNGASTCRGY